MSKPDVNKVIGSAQKFYADLNGDGNSRYKSWEYCYSLFYNERKNSTYDYDYLSLQLAFYLASWGMYRGSSFLLQKDYKIHTPIVKEILNSKYDKLLDIKCADLLNNCNKVLLEDLTKKIKDYYEPIRISVKGKVEKEISDTLITKILMGTLGCVPAYDKYFVAGIRNQCAASGTYNTKSITKLAEFYRDNVNALEKERKKYMINGSIPYPQMKLLDMGFWQIGLDIS